MASKLIFTQRTARHVAKVFNIDPPSAPVYDTVFGTYGSAGGGTTGLNFPWGLTIDAYGFYYICDYENERIVKLDKYFDYVDEYDSSGTIGRPCAIFYDANDDLYFTAVKYHIIEGDVLYNFIGVERITRSLTSVKYKEKIMGVTYRIDELNIDCKPTNICRGYSPDEILLSGLRNVIYSTTELADSFADVTQREIGGEGNIARIVGMVHHSNDLLYANTGSKILKIDSSFTNIGDSDTIAKAMYSLTESPEGSLLTFDTDTKSIIRLSEALTVIETLITDTGDTVSTDVERVFDVLELPDSAVPLYDVSNTLGYWRFEEFTYDSSPDEVVDDSGLNNHGRSFGGATSIYPGKIGSCMNFNGSSVYVNVGNDSGVFDFDQNTDFSFGAWIKTTASTNFMAVVGKEDGSRPTWTITVRNDGKVRMILQSSGFDGPDLVSDNVYNDGLWHLLIATIDRTLDVATIYIDGDNANKKSGAIPSGATYVEPATDVLIGARIQSSPDRFFNGLIDEVFVVETLLSPADVTKFWNDGEGILINPLT